LRADLQLAFDPLLSMEQYAVGGAYTVRGYRENQFVSDNGLVASLEFRFPVYHTTKQELQTMIFYDHGQSWNYKQHMDEHTLSSVGLGLRYTFTDWVTAQVYWGEKLKDISYDSDAWQDNGIHVALRVNAL
jgi:hemolysin activation/secretion protein